MAQAERGGLRADRRKLATAFMVGRETLFGRRRMAAAEPSAKKLPV